MDYNDDQTMQNITTTIGQAGLKSAVKAGRKAARKISKIVIKGIKALLRTLIAALLPYIGFVLVIAIVFFILYCSIFLVPKFMTTKINEEYNTDFSFIFGYTKDDEDWGEDEEKALYNKYNELCDSYNDGLTDFQKEQIEEYKLPWALLAAIDRTLAEPIFTGQLKRMPTPEKHYTELKPIFAWEGYTERNYTTYEYLYREYARDERNRLILDEDRKPIVIFEEWRDGEDNEPVYVDLLKNADTFDNNFQYEYEEIFIYINQDYFSVVNEKGEVLFSKYRYESKQVPEEYSKYNRLMIDSADTERKRNTNIELSKKVVKDITLVGQPLEKLDTYLLSLNIKEELEKDFIMHLAQTYDDNFELDFSASYANIPLEVVNASWSGIRGTFYYPMDTEHKVGSRFGWRMHPIKKVRKFHKGVDIGGTMGANIYASMNGIVIKSGTWGGYGNAIVIDHNGVRTVYAHMSKLLVKAGDEVTGGQIIGLCGSTGLSTGPHLHFEVREIINNKEVAVNPLKYFE